MCHPRDRRRRPRPDYRRRTSSRRRSCCPRSPPSWRTRRSSPRPGRGASARGRSRRPGRRGPRPLTPWQPAWSSLPNTIARSYRRPAPPASRLDVQARMPSRSRRSSLSSSRSRAGLLEVQLLGRGEHLLLDRDDHPLEVLGALDRLAVDGRAAAPALGGSGRLHRQEVGDVADPLGDRLRRDPVLAVVGELDLAAPVGLADRRPHRLALAVGVHQDPAPRRSGPRGRSSGSGWSSRAGTPPCRRRGSRRGRPRGCRGPRAAG